MIDTLGYSGIPARAMPFRSGMPLVRVARRVAVDPHHYVVSSSGGKGRAPTLDTPR